MGPELQAAIVTILAGILVALLGNAFMLFYFAGQLVGTVKDHDRRIGVTENQQVKLIADVAMLQGESK